ncbi:MAG: electron transfer flavoprotein subunit beta/FixA family protein [Planctomycetota bacterium]|jgi:electron transfer flavoprotein beta subunit
MNILVLLKRVPDTAAKVAVAGGGLAIDPSGVEFVMNPYDEIAVEQAIQLKEAGDAQITVLCLGPKDATKEIRTALAMGADEGILLVDEASGRDATSTAAALAAAAKDLSFDLVLAGWKAVDTDDGAVPHLLAAALGTPCVTMAVKLEVGDGSAVVHREVEGAEEVVETSLPAVISVQKGLVEPRYTSLKGIMMAKRKKIDERSAEAGEPGIKVLEMVLPPPRKEGRIVGEGAEAVPALIEALSEEQKLF